MSTATATMTCSKCGTDGPQVVHCDCFDVLCPECFSTHRCGHEHLARWTGAPQPDAPPPPPLDPKKLLSALPPRPYQTKCIDAIRAELSAGKKTLAVMATGLGKTIVMGHVAANWESGRVLVVAHRDELIQQAADKISRIVGEQCDIEMGDAYADRCSIYNRSHVVVTSVQTMCRERRQQRFNPMDFGLLMIDEAHHATASTYLNVIEYFCQNPALKVLGVTATPDRADEAALGKVFDSVAFDYQINDGITDGWLVPIRQQFVFVQGLDFSSCRTTAGDLNGADLAKVLEAEEMLHKIVTPTIELAGDQKTLVFAASVAHAERMAEICNRHSSGCAEVIHGKTDRDLRRDILKRYSRGDFQFLFNCMIATEGFDEPTVGVIAVARPTKSRALYAQMIGRGTRTLPGVVDRHDEAEARRAAIAASDKPCVTVLDFVGNSGKHKLISTADILGGNFDDEVVERARKKAASKGTSADMLEELEAARLEMEEEAKRKRQHIIATATYGTKTVDPFALFDITPKREPGWHKGRKPTDGMVRALEKFKVEQKQIEKLSFWQAKELLDKLIVRSKEGKCTIRQAQTLAKHGYSPDVSFQEANRLIDGLAKNGWKRPA